MMCRERMGRAVLRAALLATIAAWTTTGSVRAQQSDAGVQARVVDARTGEPLAGVRITAAGRVAHSDRAGEFLLVGVPDTATVRFERVGYQPLTAAASGIEGIVRLAPAPVLLNAIVVEADEPNTLAAGTALTVGSVGRAALHAGAHTSAAEAMAGAEGISVARVGSWGSRPFVRGLGESRIAVMIDGMRVNQACAFGMDQGLATLDPATIERIEILAGPGSTLFGSGNMGGVINVVTRRPAPERGLSGEVRAGASSGVPGGTAGATVALRRGGFDASLALDASRYGDYRSPAGAVHGSSFRHATADLALGWMPDAAQRLTLRSQAYEARDVGWPAMHGGSIPSQSRRSVSLDYAAQLGRGVLDGIAARAYVQRLDHEMRMEMTMGGGMPMTSVTEQRSHSTTSGGRVQLRLIPTTGSHVDVGAELTLWSAENSRWTETGGMGGSSRIEFRTWPGVELLDAGVFGQGEVAVMEGVTLTAGARADRVVRSAEGRRTTREWIGSGNAGLRLALPHGFGVRTSVGYGYRIPDPTELYGLALKPDGFVYQGNDALETETSRNVELSLTYDRPRLSASATVFRNELHDLITPVLAPGDTIAGKPVRTYANLAESRLVGATGSLHVRPAAALTLSGAVSYTRGEDAATGRPLAGIAPLEGSLTARLEGRAGRWLELEGIAAARQTRAATHTGEVETPGYAVVNARAGFRLGGIDAVAGVDNILDHAYRGHLDPVSLLRPGRSFYVKLTRRFGIADADHATDH